MALAEAPATAEVAVESVPTWYLLDFIESDSSLDAADREWFMEAFGSIS